MRMRIFLAALVVAILFGCIGPSPTPTVAGSPGVGLEPEDVGLDEPIDSELINDLPLPSEESE